MRFYRNIIHILLALAILSTGLPLHHPADMDRDGEIGLTDAIVSVRQLARTATGDGAFRDGMENTLNSLSVAAGLKTVIRTSRDSGRESGLAPVSGYIIPSSPQIETPTAAVPCAVERSIRYISPIVAPLTPPPRPGIA